MLLLYAILRVFEFKITCNLQSQNGIGCTSEPQQWSGRTATLNLIQLVTQHGSDALTPAAVYKRECRRSICVSDSMRKSYGKYGNEKT
jgi:hypothetical protein